MYIWISFSKGMLAGQHSASGFADLNLTLPSANHLLSQWTPGTVKGNLAHQETKAIILRHQAHRMTQEASFLSDTCERLRY